MRRTTLILLIVLAVVVIGGGYYLATNKDKVTDLFNRNSNQTVNNTNQINTNRVTNTSIAPVNITLPVEVKGDTTLAGTLTVNGVTINLNSTLWTDSYLDLKAGEGKKLLLVYIDAVQPTQVAGLVGPITTNVSLLYQGGSSPVRRYKVASNQVKNDRGWLLFMVPAKATKIYLTNGTGPTAESVSIPGPK